MSETNDKAGSGYKLLQLGGDHWSVPAQVADAYAESEKCRAVYFKMAGDNGELCNSLRTQLAEAQKERDAAIAHDRQPYPTAWAYEQVCASLAAAKAQRDDALSRLAEMQKERDSAISARMATPPGAVTQGGV